MQRSKINAHDILEGIERTEEFFHEIEIEQIGSTIEIVGSKRLKILIDNRVLSESNSLGSQTLFLIPDQENRATALGSFPKSKITEGELSEQDPYESEEGDILFDLKNDLESDEDDISFYESGDDRVHFSLKSADHGSEKIKLAFKPADFSNFVSLFKKIKLRLLSMLIKRFPKVTREQLSLSLVFDPSRQSKQEEHFELKK